jgi:hypothetical protein
VLKVGVIRPYVPNSVHHCTEIRYKLKNWLSRCRSAKHGSIQVPKPKWRSKTPSSWRKPTDTADSTYDTLFEQKTNQVLRKKLPEHLPPPNPDFNEVYDDAKHRGELERNLILEDYLSSDMKNRITEFVKTWWCTFSEAGVKIPVQGYELVIDTGNH